jgi:hypothetical protein
MPSFIYLKSTDKLIYLENSFLRWAGSVVDSFSLLIECIYNKLARFKNDKSHHDFLIAQKRLLLWRLLILKSRAKILPAVGKHCHRIGLRSGWNPCLTTSEGFTVGMMRSVRKIPACCLLLQLSKASWGGIWGLNGRLGCGRKTLKSRYCGTLVKKRPMETLRKKSPRAHPMHPLKASPYPHFLIGAWYWSPFLRVNSV